MSNPITMENIVKAAALHSIIEKSGITDKIMKGICKRCQDTEEILEQLDLLDKFNSMRRLRR